MKTPVALIIFNRPDTTVKVFEAIRQARPPKLLVISDGPRPDRIGEAEKCAQSRAIIDRVDWDCEVMTNYSDINLGCKVRVATGIDWVFDRVEEAIILEDDCLPDSSFFTFCEELLDKYKDDERVMSICGTNYQFGRKRTEDSYYFSKYAHIWGWATWRRAWQLYDVDIKIWDIVKEGNWLKDILDRDAEVKIWQDSFQKIRDGKIDTWDYQWTLACWIHSGFTILPNVNLISNIGFGAGATHTTSSYSKFANMPTRSITFPIQHPQFCVRDTLADIYTHQHLFDFISLPSRLRNAFDRTKRYWQIKFSQSI
jgi:hypothetical protein